MKTPYGIEDIEMLLSDRKKFEEFIYTPLDEALYELGERKKNKELEDRVKKIISRVPEALMDGPKAVLFRQLVTPNYEVRRFTSIVDLMDDFKPLFWEYYSDKFTSNNEWKHSLGKLKFFVGIGKKNGIKLETLNVIEFNDYVGKKISEVKTLIGQSLVDFHHALFEKTYPSFVKKEFFDASNWFSENGGTAKDYYKPFLSLFVQNGILFENFILDVKELTFTREVFLPAFINVLKETGKKPIIVALEPTELEDNVFWMCHPLNSKEIIEKELMSTDRVADNL